jgi:mannose-6-phosphate isomerase-like protein (cupin superfamily)
MIVNKLWGYEIWIENNDKYCGKHLHIVPGKKCSVHYHKNKKETFYVINGELLIEYSDHTDLYSWQNMLGIKTILLEKGDSFTIEPNTPHRFYTTASYPCDFIEISTHHDDNDSYRLIESC